MIIRYGVERYAGYFPNGQACYGVVDLPTGDWTRDAAGEVFRYTLESAHEVAKSLNAPRYVCECGYTVREDDREFHNSMICSGASEATDTDECPECGALIPLDEFFDHCEWCGDDIAPNAGSAD